MKTSEQWKIKLRSNYQPQDWDPGTTNTEPSMVRPEHAEDLEINNIMAQYARTGYMPANEIAQRFEDLTDIADFDVVQDKVLKARELFIQLPLNVRDTFRTAESFLEAFGTADGQKKLTDLGVLNIKQPAQTDVAGSGVQPQKSPKETPAS